MKTRIMLSNRKFIFLDRDGVLNVKPKKENILQNLIKLSGKKDLLMLLKN